MTESALYKRYKAEWPGTGTLTSISEEIRPGSVVIIERFLGAAEEFVVIDEPCKKRLRDRVHERRS